MNIKTLAESGALRQLRHNDGSEGFVIAYDKDVTDRYVAALREQVARLETELFWLKVPAADVELPPAPDCKIKQALAVIDAARLRREERRVAEEQRREVDRRAVTPTK